MGAVDDFIRFVLRRSRRRIPGVPAVTSVVTFDEGSFRDALAQLDSAQASEVLALGASLSRTCLAYGPDRKRVAGVAMQTHPDAAWIFCFDADGYIREAALRRLTSPAISTGRFVALALRLNDWVPEVRSEAVQTLLRVWPTTSPAVIATAVPYLLQQCFAWRRWAEEALYVDEIFRNPKVAEAVISKLLQGRSGALGRTLREALRFEVYDLALADMAVDARLPDVRAMAMKALFSGKATWPVGHGWAWVDKSTGERRRVVLTNSRKISVAEPPNLLEAAMTDRSAMVRKIAADVVVERMNDLPGIVEITARLANDKSAAVRDRADYIVRHLKAPVVTEA